MAILMFLFMVLTAATGIAGWVFLAAAIWATIQKTGGIRERVVIALVMWFLSAGLIVLMVFFGVVQGSIEYESIAGWQMSVPWIHGGAIE